MNIKLTAQTQHIKGRIRLDGSKSISNRVLIINALCKDNFNINGLSTSDDTRTLAKLLKEEKVLDAGHAGTTFRFMTAHLAVQNGEKILTGSERMQERPIGALVDALMQIGADIEYTQKQGYPPLKIRAFRKEHYQRKLNISGDISSQYISALAMIAPTLPDGLEIHIDGKLVSRPYLEMTLSMMSYFGVEHEWTDNVIRIEKQNYIARDFNVETDWSAASYYYALAHLSKKADIQIMGLSQESLQGDAVIQEIATKLGVTSTWKNDILTISKTEDSAQPKLFDYDFESCPDIAQTVAVMCAGNNITGVFSGLQTLRIKETDRIAALKVELSKFGVFFTALPSKFASKSDKEYFMLEGVFNGNSVQSIATYKDHRMAMAFAPLALKTDVVIENAMVVSKSYPNFWQDLEKIGIHNSDVE